MLDGSGLNIHSREGKAVITSHDVARAAGVSQATVSRALRDHRGVSPETRARVRAAAHELGYVPSHTGRALSTRRTRKIAVVSAALSNPFYPALIAPLQHALQRHDLQTVLLTDSDEQPVGTGSLTDGSFDGVVLTTCSTSSPLPADLRARGIPFAVANREVDDVDADTCVADNRRGGHLVADLLVELGHQRIAAVMGPDSTATGRERWRGFAERLDVHGVPPADRSVVRGPFAPETGRHGLETLMAHRSGTPTAVFCGNDVIALGVLDAAMSLGVRVPEDLTVVGFDDIPLASWGRFGLTTVHVDLTAMAEAVADGLVGRLTEPDAPCRRVVLSPHLVSRATHANSRTRETEQSTTRPRAHSDARMLRSWMSAVSTVARAVNGTHAPDAVLTMVAKQACDLIGFDYCAVMLPDASEQSLVVEGFSGLSSQYLGLLSDEQALQIRPPTTDQDSPAARAYRELRTIAVPDTRSATVYGRLRNLAPAQGYLSLLAAPLKQSGEVIGLLVGYLRDPHHFSALEIELAELLAEQTAIVLQTASLRREQQGVISDLSALNEEMRRARRQIDWAEEQHRQLMQLVLDDAGVDALASALAEALQASITVEGEDGRVLASGSYRAHDGSAPPDLPGLAHDMSDEFDATTAARRQTWATPVVLNGTNVGRLLVSGLDASPTPLEQRAIERFALVVGVEILQRRHLVEVRERLSGDLLADLLRPDGLTQPDAVLDRAAALGVDLTGRHALVLVHAGDPRRSSARLANLCRELLPTDAAALVGRRHESVVLLVPAATAVLPVVRRLHRTLIARTPADETIIVLGPEVGDVAGYLSAYRVAEGVARMRAGNGHALIDARALGATGLLLAQQSPPAELRQFSDRLLSGLLDETDRHHEMIETLRVWLSTGCSAAQTAEKLTVHINTIGYRLKRIAQVLGCDLVRFDTRLDLQLALLIRDIVGLSSPENADVLM